MKLIWAFKFAKSKDPTTKQDKIYDLNDFVKVRLVPSFHERSSWLIGYLRRAS